MTQQPFNSSALRGAVDLSGLGKRPTSGAPGGVGSAGAPPRSAGAAGTTGSSIPGRTGALVEVTDDTFEAVVTASLSTPLVLVLWTPQLPESVQHLRELAQAARDAEGRFQVAGVDIASSPAILQALTPMLTQVFGQVSALPVVIGLLGGQPMPFYLGVQPMAQVDQLLEKFLEAAVTNGITGRVDVSGDPETMSAGSAAGPAAGAGEHGPEGAGLPGEPGDAEPELPPLHQQAYDAIDAGDWAAAIAAYEQALQQDPADEMARLGLGQVSLLERTSHLDLADVRQRAAADPKDVQAQIEAADVDIVGGHVEDGFARLVDTVRRTAGEERDRARTHLLSLFDVIGAHDPRVATARKALMSALF